ncbi:MAG: ThiF family adenylyltransferase [Opitutae bacterium]|jgi:molybdopterin/thiamine biosynthesis adenylyltransferase|nr:ThiF family adenylyltransferase [Opitutae bacterium]MBT5693020.1 ThiF family adenylyltransferase [Opitutae bacterium]MBT6461183.1 ThiF family adenylyltransferase [Opitutae bacterium]MBT7852648.1 ThiF family adenylyltransferase [Opitutae bacterium]
MDEEQIEGAISISLEDIENLPQDGLSSGPANKQQETGDSRFSRFSLISWWDQEKIANAKILVVGAGALGNEILKNLVLTGFRNILVVDLDNIEHSNLSRSVLYRPDDIGKGKAETAAKAAMEIYEDAVVHPIDANICFNVGLGVFGWADIIIGGLDNRAARLWINQSAWKMNRPWIDGAIQGISGVAKVFLPGTAPCYECTLNEMDMQLAEKQLRNPCTGLTLKEMKGGKVPTTPTVSSIIAGIQVQEALKILHSDTMIDEDLDGNPILLESAVLAGRGYHFEGLNHTSYITEYTEKELCNAHYVFDPDKLYKLETTSDEATLDDLLQQARDDLGNGLACLEFSRNVIHKMVCNDCDSEEEVFQTMASEEMATCKDCSKERETQWINGYTGEENYGERTLAQVGLPPFDVVTARAEMEEIYYEISGDASRVLGPLPTEQTKHMP